MPFIAIDGEFVPGAGRPDGDSIRFRPDEPNLVFRLRQRVHGPKINQNNGTLQLRFEGIDSMESKALQPFSSDATASNLELCGVPDGTGTQRGHILANQLGPHGRPIAFAYTGPSPEPEDNDQVSVTADGIKQVFLRTELMKKSVNFAQIERGHAYPLFYDTLFHDLREALSDATKAARAAKKGIWKADQSQSGVTWGPVEEMKPVFPKLWRRLDKYGRDPDIMDSSSLNEFLEYLQFNHDDRVFILSEGKSTGFDNVLRVEGDTVGMTKLPEDLVFRS